MNLTKKIVMTALLLTATHNQVQAGVPEAIGVGVVFGYTYEKLLYHLPILLSIPGVCIVGVGHLFANALVTETHGFDYQAATTTSELSALGAMLLFYMMEKEKIVVRKEEHVVVVHTPYPQYVQPPAAPVQGQSVAGK